MQVSSPTAGDLEEAIRLHRELDAIGATAGGGIDRQEATEDHTRSRTVIAEWLSARGFEVRVDAIGNMFGVWEHTPGAPYVLVGSHLDSQPCAGRFDGISGVVCAAVAGAVVRREVEAGHLTPRHNVAVVSWCNEEGARFQPALLGSSVYCGLLPLEEGLAARDRFGVRLADALESVGFRGTDEPPRPAAAVLELHAEQGVALEQAGVAVGVVTHCWSTLKWRLIFHGEQAHTGGWPMRSRKDALLAAAMFIVAHRALCEDFPEGTLRTAAAWIDVQPNSPNVVPSQVTLQCDARSDDETVLAAVRDRVRLTIAEIAEKTGVEIQVERFSDRQRIPLNDQGQQVIRDAASAVGEQTIDLPTVAGHDCLALQQHGVPAALMFLPSTGGIAHNEREHTSDADLQTGVLVLTEALRRAAGGALDQRDVQG